MGKVIGKIVEVSGLSIKARLFELLPPYIVNGLSRENAPRINGFVKTKIGLDTAICQVVGEYNEYNVEDQSKASDSIKSPYYLKLEVKGYLGEKGFIQGLRVLPIVSANIELLEPEDYGAIYTSPKAMSLIIGNDLYDDSKLIRTDINELIPSHIGVFGNTGSGKSTTLTKILSSYSEILKTAKTSAGKFLVLDLNNEYGKSAICDESDKTIYKLSTSKKESEKKIPLNIDDLEEDDFIVLMNASQKTQAPVVKMAYKNMTVESDKDGNPRDERFYKNYLRNILVNSKRQLFMSMRHYLNDYIRGIDQIRYHSMHGKFFVETSGGGYIFSDDDAFNPYLENIQISIPTDRLDRFLFELYFAVAHECENGVALDFIMPLIARARNLIKDFRKVFDFGKEFKTIFEGKNVCVVQLGGVNNDMKEIIPSIVANNILKKLQVYKDDNGSVQQIINIVVDEAHNILYGSKKDSPTHESVLSVFEKVVKEGRKFGLFLMLASQRPSDISETIISQLHNYFIHKLVNPSDIAMIRKAVAYMDEHALDFITILAPGECIVSGTAFQMPTFIYVHRPKKEKRPISDRPKLSGPDGLFERKTIEANF